MKKPKIFSTIAYILLLALAFSWIMGLFNGNTKSVTYSQVEELLRKEQVESFVVRNDRDLYLVCRREQAERSPVKDFVEFLGRFYANGAKD